jgi:hypothetical protein
MSKVNLTYVQAFNLSTALDAVMEQKMPGKVAAKFVRLIKPLSTLQEDYNACAQKLSNNEESEVIELNNSVFAEFETLTEEDISSITLTPLDMLRLQPVLEQA